MINMILLTLPGVSITYNGEEIGMVDVWISWSGILWNKTLSDLPIIINFLPHIGMTQSIQLLAIRIHRFTRNSPEIRKMLDRCCQGKFWFEIIFCSERTPFQWDSTTSAGFSTNSKTWLPVASNYKEVNVKVERETPNSHLNVYKSLMRARSTRTLKYGKMLTEVFNEKVLVILRFVTERNFWRETN